MTDILLTHSNHLYSDTKQVRKMQPYPPLQTLIAAAVLREQGYSVALYDVTLAAGPAVSDAAFILDEFRAAIAEHQPKLIAVIEDNFNFLTKMCLERNRALAFRFAKAAARSGCARDRERIRRNRSRGGVSYRRIRNRDRGRDGERIE